MPIAAMPIAAVPSAFVTTAMPSAAAVMAVLGRGRMSGGERQSGRGRNQQL
jgi:hypothetical protein